MEDFKVLLEKANKSFITADHFAYVVYPLLKDNRLLLSISESLYHCSFYLLDAFLVYEYTNKRINYFPESLNLKIEVFEKQILPRYEIRKDVVKVMKDLKLIMEKHKNSPIEFARKEQFIICDDNFSSLKVVDIKILKAYILVMRYLFSVIERLN